MSEHAMAVPLQDWEPIGDRSEKPGGAPGHVVFVGVGLGGPVNITLAGVKAIAEADVVVVNDDVDPALLDEPELVLAPHSIRLVAGPQADLANLIADAKAGSVIAWLVAGDPLVDGVAAPIVGCSKPSRVDDAVRALDLELTEDEVALLEEPYVAHEIVGPLPRPGK